MAHDEKVTADRIELAFERDEVVSVLRDAHEQPASARGGAANVTFDTKQTPCRPGGVGSDSGSSVNPRPG